jgi:hypothetical protein
MDTRIHFVSLNDDKHVHGKSTTPQVLEVCPVALFSWRKCLLSDVRNPGQGYGRFLKRALSHVPYQSAELHERQRSVDALLGKKERFLTANRGRRARVLDGLAHRLAATGCTRPRNVQVIRD